jgi:hypothetical protein
MGSGLAVRMAETEVKPRGERARRGRHPERQNYEGDQPGPVRRPHRRTHGRIVADPWRAVNDYAPGRTPSTSTTATPAPGHRARGRRGRDAPRRRSKGC